MLEQTKENIQNVVNKIQLFDFVLQSLNVSYIEDKILVQSLFKAAAQRKLVLVEELLRLNGVEKAVITPVIPPVPTEPLTPAA